MPVRLEDVENGSRLSAFPANLVFRQVQKMQRAQEEKEHVIFLFVLFFSFNLLAIFFCGNLREIKKQVWVGITPPGLKQKASITEALM